MLGERRLAGWKGGGGGCVRIIDADIIHVDVFLLLWLADGCVSWKPGRGDS